MKIFSDVVTMVIKFQIVTEFNMGDVKQFPKFLLSFYSPFHSSLPFEHLGHSSLPFVCKSVNYLFYVRTETVSKVPGVLKIYSAFIFR